MFTSSGLDKGLVGSDFQYSQVCIVYDGNITLPCVLQRTLRDPNMNSFSHFNRLKSSINLLFFSKYCIFKCFGCEDLNYLGVRSGCQ